MARRYAQNTEVSIDRSEAEIKKLLMRYGAWEIVSAWREDVAVIGFRFHNVAIKFRLVLPAKTDPEFCETPTGKTRCSETALQAWERACRQRWRALKLIIQAKMEAVESRITTFEDEFLANIVIADGSTVGDAIIPRLASLKSSNHAIALLSAPERSE